MKERWWKGEMWREEHRERVEREKKGRWRERKKGERES